MIRLAALLLASVATLPAAAADRALLIGIDSYPRILVGGVPHLRDLSGAVNDARRMTAMATDVFGIAPENVVLLSEADATRDGILAAIRRDLVEATKPGDRVLFYYAGHGAQVIDRSGDEGEDGLDEVLVPYDGSVDLAVAEPELEGVILDDEIDALIGDLAGREVTVIVDSCHSGTITRGALEARTKPPTADRIPVRTITPNGPLALGPGLRSVEARLRHRADARLFDGPTRGIGDGAPKLAVWTAVTSAQFALEDMSVGGSAGLFTSRFVRGLTDFSADANRNGVITPAELLDYIRIETQLYCSRYDCLDQDPLPMLEAFDGYQGEALTRLDRSSVAAPAEAEVDVAAAAESSAIPPDVLPAHGKPVVVKLESGASATVGTALSIAVTVPSAGRLIVLDRRDDGSVVQLFPNDFSAALGADDLVTAGETVRIPGEGAPFELVADRAGRGVVTALVVDPAVDVSALTGANGSLQALADPTAYAGAISDAANRAIVLVGGGEAVLDRQIAAPPVARGDAAYEITE